MPTPEALAREKIDAMLIAADWAVQDYKQLNLSANSGIALREVPLEAGIWKREPTDEAILHEILERWHPSKRRIPPERWLKAIAWMETQGFAPTGFDRPTAVPE